MDNLILPWPVDCRQKRVFFHPGSKFVTVGPHFSKFLNRSPHELKYMCSDFPPRARIHFFTAPRAPSLEYFYKFQQVAFIVFPSIPALWEFYLLPFRLIQFSTSTETLSPFDILGTSSAYIQKFRNQKRLHRTPMIE